MPCSKESADKKEAVTAILFPRKERQTWSKSKEKPWTGEQTKSCAVPCHAVPLKVISKLKLQQDNSRLEVSTVSAIYRHSLFSLAVPSQKKKKKISFCIYTKFSSVGRILVKISSILSILVIPRLEVNQATANFTFSSLRFWKQG